MADITLNELIDFLQHDLAHQFSNEVSQIYYGDIGTYLPSSFGGSRHNQKCIIALNPLRSRPVEGTRTAGGEHWNHTVEILVMVNITPFFQANPDEAYGERMLVILATDIVKYLSELVNVDLQDRVAYTEIADINFEYRQNLDQAIRQAAIQYVVRTYVPRL